jgi:hypothetical protein
VVLDVPGERIGQAGEPPYSYPHNGESSVTPTGDRQPVYAADRVARREVFATLLCRKNTFGKKVLDMFFQRRGRLRELTRTPGTSSATIAHTPRSRA